MGHFSLRSLLVAIVICNCITWTASRHHYTHNVHRHRSRHRRQGAGLFLSSSYVIPGGEGAGAWGDWGEVSPCSRTCGGGVASQKRICLQIGPDGQPLCTGGDTKFFSCETQDCPDGSGDFRADQCSEYNDVAFKGIKYSWVPYTKGPNPCELNCMPRGERFYYRHKSKVIDGTRCSDESFDVCVDGTCQPVGCDFMLGSTAREDKCRECRGNGTNCHTVSDLINTQDLRNGYNDILLIPEGATSINIAEVKPSSNYLAIRAKNNTYYLNGDYHIDFPRSIVIAGATWHYERSQDGLPSPDKLRCLGPTYEPLYLSLLLQEPNVGVQYEYSVPQSMAPPPNQQYNWVHKEFTPCSATCGGGFQTRNVSCRSREELEVVDEGLCNEIFRPVTNQSCNTNPCPARWVEGPWGPCSELCGQGGSRSRQVHCEKIITNGYPSVVADKECFDLLGPKPALFEECNKNATCPVWFTGPWKPCDKLCGEGKQTRQVVCYQKSANGRIEVLDDEQCSKEKPTGEQPCMLHPCDGVDWVITDWTGCDTCLSTVRTRTAVCATKERVVVDAHFCDYHAAPTLEEPCDRTKLPACEVQWYATQWSKCSAECGKGVQTRRVFCGLFDGASVLKVDDTRCDNATRYNETKPCEVEQCPAKWFAGPWSECTALCGGGEQYRRLMCLRGNETVKACDVEEVLDGTQACNLGPCNEDEILPVNPNSTPIMDYDYEECEEGEDYPEVGAEEDSSLTSMMFSDSPSTDELFSEMESEFLTTAESGSESNIEGSGTTVSTIDVDYTDTAETGSEESTLSTETDETTETGTEDTGSTSTDLSGSSLATEPTVVKESGATDSASPKSESTDEGSSTEPTGTGSTVTEIDVDYDYTDGSTEVNTGETSVTESEGTTESSATGSSETSESESTESGATESLETGSTETVASTSEETGSTESGATDSSDITESSESTETGSTESESTKTETTETATTETGTTETGTTETGTTETGTTEEESTDTGSTDTGSTETGSTESGTTETGITDLSGSTESGSTESGSSTEGGTTESSEGGSSTEAIDSSGSTETSGSTEAAATESSGSTESQSTELSSTTESGSTESSSSTEVSGSTESSISTEVSGSTESSSSTEVSGSTEPTESESTESSGPPETTSSGSTEESVSTESGATETGSTESGTEETGSTELSTAEGSTETATEETGSTSSSSTETESTEGSTKGVSGYSEESSESTPYDWTTITEMTTKRPHCRPRQSKCAKTKFGCCPDKRTPAAGPFDEGCATPKTCAETKFGCCPDGVSPASGPKERGCPAVPCLETLFGCCKSDNKTPAEGNDEEGCPPPPPACKSSKHKYGCCKDEKTEATGPEKAGCPETEAKKAEEAKAGEKATTPVLPAGVGCDTTEFGCCPDGVSPAGGAQMEGCVLSCNTSAYGCCPDGETPAHGYDYEGCCLLYPFGCCPDNYNRAEGPHLEGCGCQTSRYGCCPDNVTLATGPSNEGCGCQYTEHGCCLDRHTPATGADFAGCDCHTYQFGCCEDGVTIAKGPGMLGCHCQQSEFGCCGDEKTPAVGPEQAGCDCSTSKYGCCPDGQTPADGRKFLGCTDKPEIRQAACALSTDRGPCANYSVYWYYDLQYGGCSRFWYGGCDGNGNRFTSKEECEDVCVSPAPKDACNLPMVKGACTGYHPRWYYDSGREHCTQFIFGGCLGNANNFDSREICQKQCEPAKSDDQCALPIDAGSCAGNYLRWGFNGESHRCEQFVWGGCEGNNNRFSSEAACLHRCDPPGVPKPQCKAPQEAGNCTEKLALWAFSQAEDRCMPFYYSGCGGNENRFDSQRSCAETCPSSYVKDMCTLPAVLGECADYTEKWYFDTSISRCRQFYYGGCGGNENRFSSELECESQCAEQKTTTVPPPTQQTTPADVCALPSMTGDCDNYKEKWFFDNNIGRCRQFYYGGCGGNDNRFESESECEARCVPARTTATARPQTPPQGQSHFAEVCFMEIDAGPCRASEPRWAYDAARGACVQFAYGGCAGNQNNFPDQRYCEQVCGAVQDVCQLPMLSGPCNDSQMRYFYDPASDTCSQFTYSGCGGNDNKFESLEDCERRCRTGPAPVPVTNTTAVAQNLTTPAPGEELPPVCRTYPSADEECVKEGEVWYLDAAQRACVGYLNHATGNTCRRTGVFVTEEACERACGVFRNIEVCRYPVDAGPCRAAVPKFYFDAALGSCVAFAYGGCHGGPNRFSTVDECEDVCKFEKDPCKRTPKPVNCFDYVVTWYFDETSDNCYSYGSCDPNDSNRFSSREECEGQCKREPPALGTTTTTVAPRLTPAPEPTAEEECVTPRSFDNCTNSTLVFFYDAELRACVESSHGDCGHANSYATEEECQRRCGAFRGLDPCRSPLDVGMCNSAIPKFYWKLSSGRCEPFAYSGCGGGPNRFSSADECQQVCGDTGPQAACLEAVSSGTACTEAPSRRWFYNEVSADCRGFVFQGCGGTRNNFRSPEECERACRSDTTIEVDPSENEVLPDCTRYNEECARLSCEFGVQSTRTAAGCERCSCVTVEVDCAPLQQECAELKCSYGMTKTRGTDGCERCTCIDHPCANKECPSGERCVATPYRDPISQEIAYSADCHVVNKAGTCPPEPFSSDSSGQCRRECNDDADCRGVGKCCARGCSQLCLEPATPTSPAPVTTTYAPELPQAPQANPVTEPEVYAAEGGKATLRCLFHGNPPPKITWRRGEITIDGDVGRYRLLSDGALEIVSLFRNDSGVYICVAENVHGVSQQEVRLQVNDPVESPAGISGDASAVVTGEIGRSLNIRCLAYGNPPPSIYWYRGRTMLPYSSEQYEARENVLQIRKLELDTLGEYSCQAFNGVGKAAFWSVEVRAYQPDERWEHELLVPRERTVDITPSLPRTRATSTPAPEIDVPVYTVAVNTRIPLEQTALAAGGTLSLPCDVDGYPLPEVYWTKDNARLAPDARTQITDARLTISSLTIEDSGTYGCHARNEYSSHSSTIQINVQSVLIPAHCTDNPFFADCKLIVRSKFCNHQYYSRFCCESCVRAGQLSALELGAQADAAFERRK